MPIVLAHLGHWYESVLYAAPMLIIGGVLWRTAHKERAAEAAAEASDESWDGDGDGRWDDDPRLRDD